jgi:hypothetical protein
VQLGLGRRRDQRRACACAGRRLGGDAAYAGDYQQSLLWRAKRNRLFMTGSTSLYAIYVERDRRPAWVRTARHPCVDRVWLFRPLHDARAISAFMMFSQSLTKKSSIRFDDPPSGALRPWFDIPAPASYQHRWNRVATQTTPLPVVRATCAVPLATPLVATTVPLATPVAATAVPLAAALTSPASGPPGTMIAAIRSPAARAKRRIARSFCLSPFEARLGPCTSG